MNRFKTRRHLLAGGAPIDKGSARGDRLAITAWDARGQAIDHAVLRPDVRLTSCGAG